MDLGSPLTLSKARLTEEEKRQNHIESEKKRRDAIRKGFDKLCEIVPDMQGQARSEAIVLQATVEFMRQKVAEKDRVTRICLERGWTQEQVTAIYQAAETDVRRREHDESNALNSISFVPQPANLTMPPPAQPKPQMTMAATPGVGSAQSNRPASRARSRSPRNNDDAT